MPPEASIMKILPGALIIALIMLIKLCIKSLLYNAI